MNIRYFALVFGIFYLLIGILGFVPGAVSDFHDGDHDINVDAAYGKLLGIFPVNILHTIVHLAIGLAGIAAYRRLYSARMYARAVAILFAVLTIMGLIPGLNEVFGLIPLWGNDIWLHALSAAVATYFGFVARANEPIMSGSTERI